jgi:hypothetical protein
MISKLEADELEARVVKDIELTHSLMCKFGIDPKKDDAYRKLSIILARKRYPNGVRRPGRPKKKIKNFLQYYYANRKKRGKLGRPPTKSYKDFLGLVEAVIAEHGLKGRGSDKKALEILIDECARDTKKSKLRMLDKYLKPWQKELSRARRTNRKTP